MQWKQQQIATEVGYDLQRIMMPAIHVIIAIPSHMTTANEGLAQLIH
jgi:hypothetical protein